MMFIEGQEIQNSSLLLFFFSFVSLVFFSLVSFCIQLVLLFDLIRVLNVRSRYSSHKHINLKLFALISAREQKKTTLI